MTLLCFSKAEKILSKRIHHRITAINGNRVMDELLKDHECGNSIGAEKLYVTIHYRDLRFHCKRYSL